jgi:hypothetical protein
MDLVDEARDISLARTIVYQQAIRNYHSRRVRTRNFNVGDLVLRLKRTGNLKLESPWEGPYIVAEVIPGGAYRIKNTTTRLVNKISGRQPLERCAIATILCLGPFLPSFISFNKAS